MANPFDVQVVNPLQALLLGQQAYTTGQENNKKQATEQARTDAAALYQQGDTKGALARLLSGGDLQGAGTYSTLDNSAWNRQHTEKQDARQAGRDAVTDQHWNASFGLQKRAADRADEGPVETATQRAKAASAYGIEAGTPEFKTYVLTGKLPDSIASGGQPEVGLNPAYGVGQDGKPAAIQFSKTGKAVQTQLPDGFSLSKEPIKIDMGTHIQLYDPTTRQPIGNPISKNLPAVEQQKVVGEETGKAQVALPNVLANSEQILKTLDGIEKHPGKSVSLGMGSLAPTIPGTKQADFRANLDQLNGQTFLQAYQTLKGGGAITDIEGAKGSNALARMQTAQSEASFNAALDDFKQVVKGGVERAKAKAQGGAPAPAAQSVPADPLGIR